MMRKGIGLVVSMNPNSPQSLLNYLLENGKKFLFRYNNINNIQLGMPYCDNGKTCCIFFTAIANS